MKAKILLFLIGIAASIGCECETPIDLEGTYSGSFQRGENTATVELTLSQDHFSGDSSIDKFPAICNGTFSKGTRTLVFENSCVWTADFEWGLILSGSWNYTLKNNTLTLTNAFGDVYTLVKQNNM